MTVGKLGWTSGSGISTDFELRSLYDVFEVIRTKPGVFIGRESLSDLRMFTAGFQTGMDSFALNFEQSDPDFREFGPFVFNHYGLSESAIGWSNIILEKSEQDEVIAFQKFYELLDEFLSENTN